MFELKQEMDRNDIEIQLALQCAPMITGLKISNLLIVQKNKLHSVKWILKDTDISHCVLLQTEEKAILLLYKEFQLESYISQTKVKRLLTALGYQEHNLESLLQMFRHRYTDYMTGGKFFPHEMGLFLGYPVKDVEGFIENEGKNFLYTGYWKVYENLAAKIDLFQKFEQAKETLLRLVASGASMKEVINIYNNNELQKAAV